MYSLYSQERYYGTWIIQNNGWIELTSTSVSNISIGSVGDIYWLNYDIYK